MSVKAKDSMLASRASLHKWRIGREQFHLMPGGELWRTTRGFVRAIVPAKKSQFMDTVEPEPELFWYDKSFVPPAGWLLRARLTMEPVVPGEMMALIARRPRRKNPKSRFDYEWRAYVPEQEASPGHFDSDHVEDGELKAHDDGFEVVGHMHIHPKGMVHCSQTDVNDWKKTPGLYVVLPRETDGAGLYVADTAVFHVGDIPMDTPRAWSPEDVQFVAASGDGEWQDLITEPKRHVKPRSHKPAGPLRVRDNRRFRSPWTREPKPEPDWYDGYRQSCDYRDWDDDLGNSLEAYWIGETRGGELRLFFNWQLDYMLPRFVRAWPLGDLLGVLDTEQERESDCGPKLLGYDELDELDECPGANGDDDVDVDVDDNPEEQEGA